MLLCSYAICFVLQTRFCLKANQPFTMILSPTICSKLMMDRPLGHCQHPHSVFPSFRALTFTSPVAVWQVVSGPWVHTEARGYISQIQKKKTTQVSALESGALVLRCNPACICVATYKTYFSDYVQQLDICNVVQQNGQRCSTHFWKFHLFSIIILPTALATAKKA